MTGTGCSELRVRVIGFVDGIFSGLTQWFWSSWSGSLSDSELIGRRGAMVIWVVFGFPIFVWGCLMSLRIVEMVSRVTAAPAETPQNFRTGGVSRLWKTQI